MSKETASTDRPERSAKRVAPAIFHLLTATALSGLAGCHGSSAASAKSTARSPQDTALPAAGIERRPVPAPTSRPMMPGRIHAPDTGEVSCPSMEFEPFVRAFFNSGNLQVRYTANPVAYKVPYYDYHNTEPGDPANPQWETYEHGRPMHDLYRYDGYRQAFVRDSSWLMPGQVWTGVGADGKPLLQPITDLQLRRMSATEWQVVTPGRIMTFSKRPDCWYVTGDWTLDPFEDCEWPDQCRAWREHEAPADD